MSESFHEAAEPAPTENISIVSYNGRDWKKITEGKAVILVPIPSDASDGASRKPQNQQVFYNPIQQFNRDLTVLAVRAFAEHQLEQREIAERSRQDKFKKNGSLRQNPGRKRKRPVDDADDAGDGPATDSIKDSELPLQSPTPALDQDTARLPLPSATIVGSGTDRPHVSEEVEDVQLSEVGSHTIAANGNLGDVGLNLAPQNPSNINATSRSPPKFTILDALSATGLRALRYASELPFVTTVTANDMSESAVRSIQRNVQFNGLDDRIVVTNEDAVGHMYRLLADNLTKAKSGRPHPGSARDQVGKYDVIDLDPYGTAAPFFDTALQSVRNGGLLCITCTDASIWAGGGYPEKAYALYGGVPVKLSCLHEVGLRLILHGLSTTAARYGLTIEPLLTLSVDFYARMFVTVRRSPLTVKFLASKTVVLYCCDQGCGAWQTQPMMRARPLRECKPRSTDSEVLFKHSTALAPTTDRNCSHCGSATRLAGPMYGGPIHSAAFISRVLDLLPSLDRKVYGTVLRIEGILRTTLEECDDSASLPLTNPSEHATSPTQPKSDGLDPLAFFVVPTKLSGFLSCATPPDDLFRGALRRLGYTAVRSHCKPGSVKTNAPWDVIWTVMREWVRQKAPIHPSRLPLQGPAGHLLGDQGPDVPAPTTLAVFFDDDTIRLGRDGETRRLRRYQHNPPNWGPMSKAKPG